MDWTEVTLRWHPARQGEPSKLELKEVAIKALFGKTSWRRWWQGNGLQLVECGMEKVGREW